MLSLFTPILLALTTAGPSAFGGSAQPAASTPTTTGPIAFGGSAQPAASTPATTVRIRTPAPLGTAELELITSIGGARAATYGEMTPDGFVVFAFHVGLGADDAFVDLGSGDGALVLQAGAEYGAVSSGIELAESRHRSALKALGAAPADAAARCSFVCGDASGDAADELLATATVVWCSNLCFGDELNRRLASRIAAAPHVRVVASLRPFPDGIRGLEQQELPLLCRMSWSGLVQPGQPPMPGHPCPVYLRTGK